MTGFIVLAVALFGCGGRQAQLVGTWKARPVPAKPSPILRDVSESAMIGLATQNMTIEFTNEGRFKINQIGFGAEGSYTIEGDKILLKLNTLGPNQDIDMRFGKEPGTIELDRRFESDANVVFEKQK